MSAAYYAHKNKCNYHLYESSNQVGGNAKTLNFDNFLIDTGLIDSMIKINIY